MCKFAALWDMIKQGWCNLVPGYGSCRNNIWDIYNWIPLSSIPMFQAFCHLCTKPSILFQNSLVGQITYKLLHIMQIDRKWKSLAVPKGFCSSLVIEDAWWMAPRRHTPYYLLLSRQSIVKWHYSSSAVSKMSWIHSYGIFIALLIIFSTKTHAHPMTSNKGYT